MSERICTAVARRLLGWAVALQPEQSEWMAAMRSELEEIEGGAARLAWALGGVRCAWLERRRSGAPSDGWAGPLWTGEMTLGTVGALTLAGVVLVVASAWGFGRMAGAMHPKFQFDPLQALVGFCLVLVVHEGVHALAFAGFGGRPRFGAGIKFGLPYLYCTAPGRLFTRNEFLVIGLAPLIVLDAIAIGLLLPGATANGALGALVANTSGAVGDVWFAALLVQVPRWMHFLDAKTGFAAWAPPARAGDAARLAPPRGLQLRWLSWVPWAFASLNAAALCLAAMVWIGQATSRGPNGWILALGPVRLAELTVTSHGPHRIGDTMGVELAGLVLCLAAGVLLVFALWSLHRLWQSARGRGRGSDGHPAHLFHVRV